MQKQINELLNFSTFFEYTKNKKMSVKTAYKLSKLNKAVTEEVQFYYTKMQEIIHNYALLDENGQPVPTEDGAGVKLREGAQEDCYKEVDELQQMEVTIPDITFTLDEFNTIELTPLQVEPITPFLVE